MDYATTVYWYGDAAAKAVGTSKVEEATKELLPIPADLSNIVGRTVLSLKTRYQLLLLRPFVLTSRACLALLMPNGAVGLSFFASAESRGTLWSSSLTDWKTVLIRLPLCD